MTGAHARSSAGRGGRAARPARAYALPLVMLLALVGGIAATMIVEHQAQQHLAEQRQIETYRAHHEQQGLCEMIEMWRRYGGDTAGRRGAAGGAGGAAARDAEAPGSPARAGRPMGFTLRAPGGEFYRVEIIDAQGRLLDTPTMPDGLTPDAADVLASAAVLVRRRAGESPERFLRTRGPALVDVNSAPREVLAALGEVVDDRGEFDAFADEVIREREARVLDQTRLRRIIADAGGFDDESAGLLSSLFVFESSLQRVEVEARHPARRTVARHTGLLLGDTKASARHPWAFLSWERRLEADEDGARLIR